MAKTQQFASILGETYTVVRNVYGRPGREPRQPGPSGDVDFQKGAHRRFVVADALAWTITRDLTALGLTWDEAAPLVRRERVADAMMVEGIELTGQLFAAWVIQTDKGHETAAWRGSVSEIADLIAHDQEGGSVLAVRMISLKASFETAVRKAADAGFEFIEGEFRAIEDEE